jgi:hypothetical protein
MNGISASQALSVQLRERSALFVARRNDGSNEELEICEEEASELGSLGGYK